MLNNVRAVAVMAALGVLAVVLSAPSAGAVAGYGDVEAGRYYTEPVQWSVDVGGTGIDGPCFEPSAPVTRGELAVWLHRMQGLPDPGRAHGFVDVTDPAQHDAVSWMVDQGITTGTSATTFSPGSTLNRGELAAFLWRLDGKPPVERGHGYVDVTAPWQQAPVSWMVGRLITTGTTESTFSPDWTLSRAQIVTFLWRYKNRPTVTIDPHSPACDPNDSDDETPVSDTHDAEPSHVQQGRIVSPSDAPSGRCAARLASGTYAWEACAWAGYWDDKDHNWSLTDEEAADLARRIWDEVDVEGKPARPPTYELVPSGGRCAVSGVIGCYNPSTHHVQRLGSFLRIMLHETAHALVANHPTVSDCHGSVEYQKCVHNDIFRCAANHLYVTYAGLPDAGVCGGGTVTDPTLPPKTKPAPNAAPGATRPGTRAETDAAVAFVLQGLNRRMPNPRLPTFKRDASNEKEAADFARQIWEGDPDGTDYTPRDDFGTWGPHTECATWSCTYDPGGIRSERRDYWCEHFPSGHPLTLNYTCTEVLAVEGTSDTFKLYCVGLHNHAAWWADQVSDARLEWLVRGPSKIGPEMNLSMGFSGPRLEAIWSDMQAVIKWLQAKAEPLAAEFSEQCISWDPYGPLPAH